MTIHILTLTWNASDKIANLLSDLNSQDIDFVWHVRDNGSNDNTKNILENCKSYIKPYFIGHNRDNFAQGVNYLFDQAAPKDDDLILLLNNDIRFKENNSISKMKSLMDQTNAAAVGAKLYYEDKKVQHMGVAFGPKYGLMPWHIYRATNNNDSKNKYFQAVTAAVCLIRADVFKEVGKFNHQYRWAFEDVDLCLKISQKYKIALCGSTNIIHEESASLKKNPINKLFLKHNIELFKKNWWEGSTPKYNIDYDLYINNPNYNVI